MNAYVSCEKDNFDILFSFSLPPQKKKVFQDRELDLREKKNLDSIRPDSCFHFYFFLHAWFLGEHFDGFEVLPSHLFLTYLIEERGMATSNPP